MAKRPQTKPKSRSVSPRKAKPSERLTRGPKPVGRLASRSPQAPVPSPPSRRSTYFEAVAIYEKGLEALQRRDYRGSVELFESVLRLYPDERELLERVRLYLNVGKSHLSPREAAPKTLEERLYAATLAFNGGRYDEAISHLRLVRDEDPDNDHALYMLAVAHAQRAEHTEAIAHLERAIALNPENRSLARRDPDLEMLRGDDAFRSALETAAAPRTDRSLRRPIRSKLAR